MFLSQVPFVLETTSSEEEEDTADKKPQGTSERRFYSRFRSFTSLACLGTLSSVVEQGLSQQAKQGNNGSSHFCLARLDIRSLALKRVHVALLAYLAYLA